MRKLIRADRGSFESANVFPSSRSSSRLQRRSTYRQLLQRRIEPLNDMAPSQQCVRISTTISRPALSKTKVPSGRRFLNINQDVQITRTGKPIIKVQGGRSSLGGHTATVFGATGFLGRYIVNRLARSGCTVVVPFREEMGKRHLKVTGDLGRVVFIV
jgi:hypothetical protein